MNDIDIINEFAEKFYKKPVLRTWTPDDWEKKYYDTEKKLAKEKAKRDAAYAKDFEREMRDYTAYRATVERIAKMPQGIIFLFARTAKHIVEKNVAIREGYEAEIKAFTDKYDREIEFTFKPENDKPYTHTFNPAKVTDTTYFLANYDFKNDRWAERTNDYLMAQIKSVAETDEGRVAFMKDMQHYVEVKHNLYAMRSDASLFCELMEECGRIMVGIDKTLGGDPDACSYNTNWGVGGHFNGIVSRGAKRASFTSFLAGGWNIQRLHIRYRVTLLKD